MRGSRKFRQGGPGQSDKKALTTFFFFGPQLIFTEVKWSISKKSIIFQGFRGGPTFSRGGGGGPTFSSCLFPIETHITCDFPGGYEPPVPTSGSALAYIPHFIPQLNINFQTAITFFEWYHFV